MVLSINLHVEPKAIGVKKKELWILERRKRTNQNDFTRELTGPFFSWQDSLVVKVLHSKVNTPWLESWFVTNLLRQLGNSTPLSLSSNEVCNSHKALCSGPSNQVGA